MQATAQLPADVAARLLAREVDRLTGHGVSRDTAIACVAEDAEWTTAAVFGAYITCHASRVVDEAEGLLAEEAQAA